MIWSDDAIRCFLKRYGQALGAGDLPQIVACWGAPALLLANQGARPVSSSAEVEQFFAGAVAWYQSQGLVAAKPQVERIEALGEKLASVDVRWAALDATGAERSVEHSRYVLGAADDGSPCIRVAISISE